MGHSVDIHKEYYRLPDDVAQMAKISKLLLALESGKIKEIKGQNFDNIPLSDGELEDDQEIGISGTSETISTTLLSGDNLHPDVNNACQGSKPVETEAENLDNVPDDSRIMKSAGHKKRRAAMVRKPWSKMEKDALLKHFQKNI
jgi:hypothetical protein